MNDDEACADLCEEKGFLRQAELLRGMARGGFPLFAVVERVGSDDFEYLEDEGGVPRALHLDRDEAERDALRRNIRCFRERDLGNYCGGYLEDIAEVPRDQLERQIGAILGTDYTLPDPDLHHGPSFPSGATDSQIRAIMDLFTLRFFYVAAVMLAS